MSEELFSPTIQQPRASGRPPWRPESIVYPGFFAGPLAAATLGVINGRRLGLRPGLVVAIAAAGVAAFVARIVVTSAVDGGSTARFVGSVAGVLVWLVVLWCQRRPFRAFTLGNAEPASLVGPGFAAAVGCGVLEAIVIFGLVR